MSNKMKNKKAQKTDNKPLIIAITACVLLLAIGVGVLVLPGACADLKVKNLYKQNMKNPSDEDTAKYSDFVETDEKTEYVKIAVEGHGEMIVKLDAETAPITVENYQDLVSEKFYDGLTFHRIRKNFMIQGGDPEGTGNGGSGKTIKGEFSENGVENGISHKRGVISMARGSYSNDSASSQFFICRVDYPSLDGKYAAFGKVVAGYRVLDSIADVEVKSNGSGEASQPVSPVVISSVRFVKLK